MEQITKLDWDSDFFEKRVGKVLISCENTFAGELFKNEASENYDLVYVFSYGKMLTKNEVLFGDLELVDIMITMSMPFDSNLYKNNEYDFKTAMTLKEVKECHEIAEQTAIVSRFYDEEMIGPKKTKELYRKWIDNAFNNSFSDGMFVVKDENCIAGVHLIKVAADNAIGYFTLTGVNSTKKKSGFGRKLWNQSFGYFANETNITKVSSVFSQRNLDSLNFHLKMGFNKVQEVKYIYHFRNKNL